MKKYFLSTPILTLLLVYSIKCVDLYKIKRVPRQDREALTITSNHPPSVETYIPVSVIYDDENISTLSKSIKQESATEENGEDSKNIDLKDPKSITKVDENYGNYTPLEEKPIKPSENKANDKESQVISSVESENQESPSVGLDQSSDFKTLDNSKSIIKPKGRSLNYESPDSTVEIESSTNVNDVRVRKQRRRLQRVNKVRVNTAVPHDDQKSENIENKSNQAEIQSRKIDGTNKNSAESKTTARKRTQQRVNNSNEKIGVTRSQNRQTEIKPRNEETTTLPTDIKEKEETKLRNTQTEIQPRKIDGTRKNSNQSTTNTNFQKRTQQRKSYVPIVESENYVFSHQGDFHYSYEGGDGTKAFERGELKSFEGGSSGSGVVGGFSYTDQEGNDFSLTYTADENGYRPIGAHLPTPPPIPIAIQRALALLATKTTPEPATERIKS